jgi:hypothetical protein
MPHDAVNREIPLAYSRLACWRRTLPLTASMPRVWCTTYVHRTRALHVGTHTQESALPVHRRGYLCVPLDMLSDDHPSMAFTLPPWVTYSSATYGHTSWDALRLWALQCVEQAGVCAGAGAPYRGQEGGRLVLFAPPVLCGIAPRNPMCVVFGLDSMHCVRTLLVWVPHAMLSHGVAWWNVAHAPMPQEASDPDDTLWASVWSTVGMPFHARAHAGWNEVPIMPHTQQPASYAPVSSMQCYAALTQTHVTVRIRTAHSTLCLRAQRTVMTALEVLGCVGGSLALWQQYRSLHL